MPDHVVERELRDPERRPLHVPRRPPAARSRQADPSGSTRIWTRTSDRSSVRSASHSSPLRRPISSSTIERLARSSASTSSTAVRQVRGEPLDRAATLGLGERAAERRQDLGVEVCGEAAALGLGRLGATRLPAGHELVQEHAQRHERGAGPVRATLGTQPPASARPRGAGRAGPSPHRMPDDPEPRPPGDAAALRVQRTPHERPDEQRAHERSPPPRRRVDRVASAAPRQARRVAATSGGIDSAATSPGSPAPVSGRPGGPGTRGRCPRRRTRPPSSRR